jgi:cyclopropane fatty-acyl-phospholipid synthase-like methyltransferase
MTDTYYNDLAPYYKFIYQDWEASLQRQAKILDSVIREFIGEKAKTVLDVACGIGTQSIGLAGLGYRVTGSDLSATEVELARQEALKRGLDSTFQVADMRQAWEMQRRQYEVVIACDNAVPHLLSDQDILSAFKQFYRCLKPGGGCLISVRDYTQLERKDKQKQLYPRGVRQTDKGQAILFDVWDFDGDYYKITTYIVEDVGQPEAKTQVIRGGKYYCVEISTLEKLFQEAGFREVTTLRERFFQPLLVAVK